RLADHLLRIAVAAALHRPDLLPHRPDAAEETGGADDALVRSFLILWTVRADDAFVGPCSFLVRGRNEQRVDAFRVRTEALDQFVGRYDIESRLRHLPDFGNELAICAFLVGLVVAPLHVGQSHSSHVLSGIAIALLRDDALIEKPREGLFEID